jgi:hypothetical protein
MTKRYQISEAQFNRLLDKTRISRNTRRGLKKVLVHGKTYEESGFTKQFIYKKIKRIKELAKEEGLEIFH